MSLPENRLKALEPWDLPELKPYEPAYLSGFRAQRYQIELPEGFETAKRLAAGQIESDAWIQWLLAEEARTLRERLSLLGLSLYGDLQVGLSQQDLWAWRRVFLDGRLGFVLALYVAEGTWYRYLKMGLLTNPPKPPFD